MTEKSELEMWIEDLHAVALDLRYEAAAKPGHGEEVAGLLSDAAIKVEGAMDVLRRVLEVMG